MYILVDTEGENTTTTFSDITKLRDWVLERNPLESSVDTSQETSEESSEVSAKELLNKMVELLGPWMKKEVSPEVSKEAPQQAPQELSQEVSSIKKSFFITKTDDNDSKLRGKLISIIPAEKISEEKSDEISNKFVLQPLLNEITENGKIEPFVSLPIHKKISKLTDLSMKSEIQIPNPEINTMKDEMISKFFSGTESFWERQRDLKDDDDLSDTTTQADQNEDFLLDEFSEKGTSIKSITVETEKNKIINALKDCYINKFFYTVNYNDYDSFKAEEKDRKNRISYELYFFMTRFFVRYPTFFTNCLPNHIWFRTKLSDAELKLLETYKQKDIFECLLEFYDGLHLRIKEKADNSFNLLYKYINQLYPPPALKKYPEANDDFFQWEQLIYRTLCHSAAKKVSKDTIGLWIVPFIKKELQKSSEGQIQSSELYTKWIAFIEKLFSNFYHDDRHYFVSLTNTRHFAKLLKSMGIQSVRKSSGIFYVGIESKKEKGTVLEEVSGFNSLEPQYSGI